MIQQLYDRFNSLGELLKAGIEIDENHSAIIYGDWHFSYRQIEILSNKVANFLVSKGIKRNDRIALCCVNSHLFVIWYFGILKAGATVVPINYLLSPEEIRFIFTDSKVNGLAYYHVFEQSLKPVVDSASIGLLVSIGKPDGNEEKTISKQPQSFLPRRVDQKNDVAVILYTSGTTGRPKGVMLTHRNLLFDIDAIIRFLPISEKDIFISVLPMFHAFGATASMLTPIALGGCIVAIPKFAPEAVAEIIKKTRATVFMGVPSMYVIFNKMSEKIKDNFSSLRFCISGGAALPVNVLEEFERKFGVLIYEGDGPTECSPVTSVNPVGGKRKTGSIGLPLPGIEMKIVDESGNEQDPGEIGEIVVRGENVMKGYLNLPEETTLSFLGAWFRTGDFGYKDKDGYFYIVDRKKELIIVNGLNVYPKMVEDVLYRHPAITEAAVVKYPHPLHGEVPKAFIVTKEGEKLSTQEVRIFCSKFLAHYEVPKIIEFVSELPKTPTGKIDKKALTKR